MHCDKYECRIMLKRLDVIEMEMKRIASVLEKMWKQIQKNDSRKAPEKPSILPLASLQALEAFENIGEEEYSDVVDYLQYVGGFTARDAIYLCFKEALEDNFSISLTWLGGKGKTSLCERAITRAMYDAVSRNEYVGNLTRCDFQSIVKAALRAAQERAKGRARRAQGHEGDFVTVHSGLNSDSS